MGKKQTIRNVKRETDAGYTPHQCVAIGFREGKRSLFIVNGKPLAERIDALVDHINRFSLAGIARVRKDIETWRLRS